MMSRFLIVLFMVLFAVFAGWQARFGGSEGSEADFVSLFNGHTLDGWYAVGGDATYRVDDGTILGTYGPGANSFLRTEAEFTDFELKLEMRWDELGNSGVMFRAAQRDDDGNSKGNGRVYGYQYELDHSDRAWSGGIYDEARRGWINNLEDNEAARQAIRLDDWNEVHIKVSGASIQTWLNGVPAADLIDTLSARGFIALQVHSGNSGAIRWRNIRLRELESPLAPGPALDKEGDWRVNDMPEVQFADSGWQGQPAADALLTTRRQFGEFEARFSLGVCEQPQRVQFRHHPMGAEGGRHVEVSLTGNSAQATVVTAAGKREAEAVSLPEADAHEVRLLASGNRVVVTVGEVEVLRWQGDGLPDAGPIIVAPAACADGFLLQNFSWTDLRGGSTEPLFYETLDNEPAPVFTPAQAQADFLLAPGFSIELVAAEPLVEDPVAMAWDEFGRLYVVEMRGFMPDAYGVGQEEPVGQVVRLTDTDGDGQMDTSEVFLDGLINPRAVAVVNDGILIGEPPHLWLCELPTPESACANKRSLGEYGMSDGDTSIEHLENGLLPGLDNWLLSAKSNREMRMVDGELEVRTTVHRGQWGITKDDFGRVLYNNNSNFITADFIAASDQATAAGLTDAAGVGVVLTAPEEVFSARVNPGVNRAYLDNTLREDGRLYHATAVSGLAVYRGDQFPQRYRGNVFVPEPGANVVAQFQLSEDGAALSAEHSLYADSTWGQREFLASTDERFRPVDAFNGPDGALYILDMYRGIIQEQHFLTEELREQIFTRELDRPLGHGRIWRVVHTEGKADGTAITLGDATTAELVAALASDNGWVRDTAQRLLLQPQHQPGAALADWLQADNELAAVHALWTLAGRNELTRKQVLAAINAAKDARQLQALRAGAKLLTAADLNTLLQREDLPAVVHLQLAYAMQAQLQDPTIQQQWVQLAAASVDSALLRQALVRAATGREFKLLQALFAADVLQDEEGAQQLLTAMVAAAYLELRGPLDSTEPAPAGLLELLDLVAASDQWQQIALLDGLRSVTYSTGFVPAQLAAAPPIFSDTRVDEDSPLWPARLSGRRAFTWPGDELAAGITPLSPTQLALMAKGERFYNTCASCHGPGGAGIAGLAPSLVNAPWVLGPPEWLGRILLQGMTGPVEIDGKVWNGLMPPHGGQAALDDETLAGLMIYLRRSWGHGEDPVSIAMVESIREATAGRTTPWTVAELEQVPVDRGYGRLVGDYKISFLTLTVYEADGELNMKVPMYGDGPMQPLGDNRFNAAAGDETVELEFIVEDDGMVRSLVMIRQGQRIPIPRVEG
ncbi:DUF1080 domain-containing protein [Halieaceae bacterium IMCC14734]|uniref:DUF1080 domain-containing protein n=1 Tax=Candidatus Litorirhabdus singularis TaxID=2518993 RepID=A0ABT3TIM1_9GAMM|nr:family 16 glycoside hydrolase [Candidatus Litorirhabdus singularis]MCX2982065.1 DUF1080 domain-containing protein [Candidatus Litorirhabdus singularis]